MTIAAAFMVPHPPMIVPAIGRGSERQVAATARAYEQVAAEIAELKPDTIIISSPHSVMYMDYFHISPGEKAKGSFRDLARRKPGSRKPMTASCGTPSVGLRMKMIIQN